MVDKVFEIIDYFKPKYWWIENPQTGKMKEYINDLIPFVDVHYCQYGISFKKPTRFWTNIEGLKFKKCNHKKHNGSKDWDKGKLERYKIPPILIAELLCLTGS